ncbi:carboxymuconolactone decarboxylase family protein [Roseiterribacter gracilis]|uniref:Carboxymuconolactone decarboxylase n=1 Tax=Roseiterribacter gracilis TaxID=2812848 RepID=A0A8S8XIJ7_9PROT|nr:carboxymuconolactone decarboxylase [Rhodospirillales bacterium TMPK1]
MSADRMPPLADETLTDAQRAAAKEFAASRGVQLFGPFVPLLRSPELLSNASAMGQHLRYRSSLPLKLSELVILLIARQWTQQVEWQIHHPAALKAGLSPAIAQAIAEGRRPDGMDEQESAVWEFCRELHTNRAVCDSTYATALSLFGEQGIADLCGLNGYYTLLAMTMNVARTPTSDGSTPLKPL